MMCNHKLAEELQKLKLAFTVINNMCPLFTTEVKETSFIFLSLENQSAVIFVQNGVIYSSKR